MRDVCKRRQRQLRQLLECDARARQKPALGPQQSSQLIPIVRTVQDGPKEVVEVITAPAADNRLSVRYAVGRATPLGCNRLRISPTSTLHVRWGQ